MLILKLSIGIIDLLLVELSITLFKLSLVRLSYFLKSSVNSSSIIGTVFWTPFLRSFIIFVITSSSISYITSTDASSISFLEDVSSILSSISFFIFLISWSISTSISIFLLIDFDILSDLSLVTSVTTSNILFFKVCCATLSTLVFKVFITSLTFATPFSTLFIILFLIESIVFSVDFKISDVFWLAEFGLLFKTSLISSVIDAGLFWFCVELELFCSVEVVLSSL